MRYKAFISYASADRLVGERFHRAIEHYKIPKPLRGADHGLGPVLTRLTPLFRDRSDADAGADLGETLHAALGYSDALIVLCSPAAARSRWVNEEIRAFKALGRERRIFPVLIDGAPQRFDAEHAPGGAFPPALFQRIDAAGSVIAEDAPEPLAPDIRPEGDGPHFAKLKIVAALTGVSLTLLTQRQSEAERRERLIVRWVAGAMSALALIASITAFSAWRSAEYARARLEDAIEMAARRVDDAARFQDAYGVPIEVIRQLLAGAEQDFGTLIDARAATSPTLQLQRARLLVLFSDLYGAVGDGERQLTLARDARAAIEATPDSRTLLRPSSWFARLPAAADIVQARLAAMEALALALLDDPSGGEEALELLDQGRALAHQQGDGLYAARFAARRGEALYNLGQLEPAEAAYAQALAELEALIARGGDTITEAQIEAGYARSDRAEALLELERHQEALNEQRRAADTFGAAAKSSPDAAAQRDFAHALARLGDMLYAASGDWSASAPLFVQSVAILDAVRAGDPARIDFARDLSIGLERLGDARLQQGDLGGARAAYQRQLALRREVLGRDPRSLEARRDVAVALERQADLALAGADLRTALAALDEARALRADDATADADPVYTRDMAVLWSKTAQARTGGGGDWDGAFQTAIVLMRPLIEIEGAPPGWMRDLVVFYSGYADALDAQGRRQDALAQWRAALMLSERQQRLNPDDPRLADDAAHLRARIAAAE